MATPLSSEPVPATGDARTPGPGPLGADPPRAETPGRLARLSGPLLTAGIVAAGTVGLRLRDPHVGGSWGYCPWAALTGGYCPGCGALRAVNDLTHGDVLGAASSNLLFVAFVPLIAYWWLRAARRAWAGTLTPPTRARRTSAWFVLALVVAVAFTVLRNTPAGSWLAP